MKATMKSKLLAIGGPGANLLTFYVNDFLPAVYNGTHLTALSYWSKMLIQWFYLAPLATP